MIPRCCNVPGHRADQRHAAGVERTYAKRPQNKSAPHIVIQLWRSMTSSASTAAANSMKLRNARSRRADPGKRGFA